MISTAAIRLLLAIMETLDDAACVVGWHAWGPPTARRAGSGYETKRACATCGRVEALRRWTVTGETWEAVDG